MEHCFAVESVANCMLAGVERFMSQSLNEVSSENQMNATDDLAWNLGYHVGRARPEWFQYTS